MKSMPQQSKTSMVRISIEGMSFLLINASNFRYASQHLQKSLVSLNIVTKKTTLKYFGDPSSMTKNDPAKLLYDKIKL